MRWREFTLDHGLVLFGHRFPASLNGEFGLFGAREDEQPGGFAIQSMHDKDAGVTLRGTFADVGRQLSVSGARFLAFCGDGEQTGRFVDDYERFIFIKDLNATREHRSGGRVFTEGNANFGASLQQGIVTRRRHAGDGDGLEAEEVFGVLSRQPLGEGEQKREQLHGLADAVGFFLGHEVTLEAEAKWRQQNLL